MRKPSSNDKVFERGSLAPLISLISLVVVTVGVIVGTQLYSNLNTASEAQSSPEVCDNIRHLVADSVVNNALANPESISGWGVPDNPAEPVSPRNPLRSKLSLKNINQPYHPLYNNVIYKAQCDEGPTATPTVPPNPEGYKLKGKITLEDPSEFPELGEFHFNMYFCPVVEGGGFDCKDYRIARIQMDSAEQEFEYPSSEGGFLPNDFKGVSILGYCPVGECVRHSDVGIKAIPVNCKNYGNFDEGCILDTNHTSEFPLDFYVSTEEPHPTVYRTPTPEPPNTYTLQTSVIMDDTSDVRLGTHHLSFRACSYVDGAIDCSKGQNHAVPIHGRITNITLPGILLENNVVFMQEWFFDPTETVDPIHWPSEGVNVYYHDCPNPDAEGLRSHECLVYPQEHETVRLQMAVIFNEENRPTPRFEHYNLRGNVIFDDISRLPRGVNALIHTCVLQLGEEDPQNCSGGYDIRVPLDSLTNPFEYKYLPLERSGTRLSTSFFLDDGSGVTFSQVGVHSITMPVCENPIDTRSGRYEGSCELAPENHSNVEFDYVIALNSPTPTPTPQNFNFMEKYCTCDKDVGEDSGTCSTWCGVYGTERTSCTERSQCILDKRNTIRVATYIQGEYPQGADLKVTLLKRIDGSWVENDVITWEDFTQEYSEYRTAYKSHLFDNIDINNDEYRAEIKVVHNGSPVSRATYIMSDCSGDRTTSECIMRAPGFNSYFIDSTISCVKQCVYRDDNDNRCYQGGCVDDECGYNLNCEYLPSCGDKQEISCPGQPEQSNQTEIKKVLPVIVNPNLLTEGGTLFDKYDYFKDPDELLRIARRDINDIPSSSVQYEFVDTVYRDTHPPLTDESDMVQYERDLIECQNIIAGQDDRGRDRGEVGGPCHNAQTNIIDYVRYFEELDLCHADGSGRANEGEIDEIWAVYAPYTGAGEGDMIGPDPFGINGMAITNENCKRNIPALSIDVTRHHSNALHSYGHRIEATMSFVYGSWELERGHNWNNFGLTKQVKDQVTGCGSVHYPPNTTKEYGYNDFISHNDSYCDNFYNYSSHSSSSLFENSKNYNCAFWNCDQRGYMLWWMGHIPHWEGVHEDGKYNNWWRYIANPDEAIKHSPHRFARNSDLNDDEVVNTFDLAILMEEYQREGGPSAAIFDIVQDESINALDMSAMISNQGYALNQYTFFKHFGGDEFTNPDTIYFNQPQDGIIEYDSIDNGERIQ